MVGTTFSLVFLGTCLATLALFAAGEYWKSHRNTLAALAAVLEALVFAELAWLFLHINWGGTVPAGLMALLPLGGSAFSLNMAHKRLTGRTL